MAKFFYDDAPRIANHAPKFLREELIIINKSTSSPPQRKKKSHLIQENLFCEYYYYASNTIYYITIMKNIMFLDVISSATYVTSQ